MADKAKLTNNISFDDGYKEFTINNDPNRILKVNVKDVGLITRMHQCLEDIQKKVDVLNEDEFKFDAEGNELDQLGQTANAIGKTTEIMNEAFDELFYPGAHEVVFGQVSPLSTVNGVTVFENFLKSFSVVLEPFFKEETEKREKHINEYQKKYEELRKKRTGK